MNDLRPLDLLILEHGSKCHYCKCETDRVIGSPNQATIEHLVDKWSSPKHQKIEDPSNLVVACARCNHTRGAIRNKIARGYYGDLAKKAGKKLAVASIASKELYKMFGAVPQHLFD